MLNRLKEFADIAITGSVGIIGPVMYSKENQNGNVCLTTQTQYYGLKKICIAVNLYQLMFSIGGNGSGIRNGCLSVQIVWQLFFYTVLGNVFLLTKLKNYGISKSIINSRKK